MHGLHPTTLQHKLSPTHEPHRPNIDDVEAVLLTTLDARILDSIGEIAGGVMWVRPCKCADELPEMAMLTALQELHTKVARMIETITEWLEDSHLDEREMAELELRTRRMVSGLAPSVECRYTRVGVVRVLVCMVVPLYLWWKYRGSVYLLGILVNTFRVNLLLRFLFR